MEQFQPDAALSRRRALEREQARRSLGFVGGFAVVGELGVILVSLLAAFWVKFESGWIRFGVLDERITLVSYLGLLGSGLAGLALLLHARGAYGVGGLLTLRRGLSAIIRAVSWWCFLYLSLSLLLKLEPPISRVFVTLAAAFALLGLAGFRLLLLRPLIRRLLHSSLRQRAIVVGYDRHVVRLAAALRDGATPGVQLAAIYSTHPEAATIAPIAGGESDALRAVEIGEADCVFLADGALSPAETISLANACERRYLPFKLIPSSFQVLLSGLQLELVGGVPVLATQELPLNQPVNRLLKRSVDVVGALVGLFVALPIVALCGYLIRRESPGPILFRQRRVGRNGREFTMFKLRTMRLDAEATGPGWTRPEDPRRLRIGSVLRSWNLDELPQFWNVLKGEMSLVGPRPERPEWISEFEHTIPHYNARHTCKPGITGWAQVSGLRGDTDVSERVRFDLEYVERWTLPFDAYILALTLVRRRNAY